MGELVTVVLPDLARRAAVDVRSDAAAAGRAQPRPAHRPQARSDRHRPQRAADAGLRLAAGRAHRRGQAGLPARPRSAARRAGRAARGRAAARRARSVPGRRTSYDGADAPRFVEKLGRWRGDLAGDAAGIVKPAATLAPAAARHQPRASRDAESVRFELTFVRRWPRRRGQDARRIGRRRRGRARLAGGARARAARRRRLGAAAARLAARSTASASPICSPRARTTAAWRAHALPALAALCAELEHPPPAGPRSAGAARRRASSGSPRRRCRADLTATLRAYQRQGVDWLAFLRDAGLGGVLADDMGLGKTLQALCALEGPTLVVCPTSVLLNWQAEMRALPARPAGVASTTAPARALDATADVTLTSYALLRLDATALSARALGRRGPRRGAGDQEPRQPGRARRVRAARAGSALALTGTPVENRLDELWSLMHFTNRGLLGGRARLRRTATRARSPTGDAARPRALRAAHPAVRAAPAEAATSRPSCRRAPRPCCASSSTTASAPSTTRSAPRPSAEVVALLAAAGRQRAGGARGAAAPAPGRLPPGARARARARRRSSKLEALLEALDDRRRRGPQGAGVLAVDLAARSRSSRASQRAEHRRSCASTARTRDRGDGRRRASRTRTARR